MALGVAEAVAELLRDGDPAPDRLVDGLDTLRGFRLYDDADTSKRHIFVTEEPPDPDESVTVLLEGGARPIGGGGAHPIARQPAFTVRSRAASSETAQEIAHEVHAILDYFHGLVRGIPFFRIDANFEPLPLGRDRSGSGGRWVFSQTFRSISKRYALS